MLTDILYSMNTKSYVRSTFDAFYAFRELAFRDDYATPDGYVDPVHNIEISCMFKLTTYRGDCDTFLVCEGYKDGRYVGREVFD